MTRKSALRVAQRVDSPHLQAEVSAPDAPRLACGRLTSHTDQRP